MVRFILVLFIDHVAGLNSCDCKISVSADLVGVTPYKTFVFLKSCSQHRKVISHSTYSTDILSRFPIYSQPTSRYILIKMFLQLELLKQLELMDTYIIS